MIHFLRIIYWSHQSLTDSITFRHLFFFLWIPQINLFQDSAACSSRSARSPAWASSTVGPSPPSSSASPRGTSSPRNSGPRWDRRSLDDPLPSSFGLLTSHSDGIVVRYLIRFSLRRYSRLTTKYLLNCRHQKIKLFRNFIKKIHDIKIPFTCTF